MDRRVSVNLRRILKEKNITQEKLAVRTGLSKAAISNIVNCNIGPRGPRDDSLDLICKELGIAKDELYAAIDDPIVEETTDALKQAQLENAKLKEEIDEKDEAMMNMVHQLKLMRASLDTSNAHHADEVKDLRRVRTVLAVALVIVLVLLLAVAFYAGFAFLAFDVMDPTRGIWRG